MAYLNCAADRAASVCALRPADHLTKPRTARDRSRFCFRPVAHFLLTAHAAREQNTRTLGHAENQNAGAQRSVLEFVRTTFGRGAGNE